MDFESTIETRTMLQNIHATQGPNSGNPKCVLLAGSARGGTSWALKVLDSHPAICGCHEPFHQLSSDKSLHSLFERMKTNQGTSSDAEVLIRKTIEGCVKTHKPPFFEKDFLITPAWLRAAAWSAAKVARPMESVFRGLATGNLNENHRLVIKNRPFPMLDRVLDAIQADVLILLRHPCGVVSSWLKGIQMGIMGAESIDPVATWKQYASMLEPLGFTQIQLQKLSAAGILAIHWLVDTLLFRQYEESGVRTRTIVYCDLVRNPVEEWSKVFDWLDLPMCSSVESFLTNSSRSIFDVRQLLGKRYTYFSVKRSDKAPMVAWRKQLSHTEIEEVLAIVTPHFPLEAYWPESTPRQQSVLV